MNTLRFPSLADSVRLQGWGGWASRGGGLHAIFHRLLLLLNLGLLGGPALAVDQVVTSLADSGPGSLRQAIADVHDGGTITFSISGVIDLTGNDLSISKHLTITGPGADLLTLRRASGPNRIFYVVNNLANNGSATISGLTIRDGTAGFDGGGGVLLVGDANAAPSESSLTLDHCYITNCSSGGRGGGVKVDHGLLTMRGCTLSQNHADSEMGGGVSIWRSQATLESCTIAENTAPNAAGIYMESSPVLMTSCTIAHNPLSHVDNDGGSCLTNNAGAVGGGTLTFRNNIFKAAPNSFLTWPAMYGSGAFLSQGYNFCADAGLGLTGPGDRPNTNALPGIDTTGNNGGPVPTIELRQDSPALDQGKSFDLTEDERGLPRVRDAVTAPNASGGDGADAGASELQDFSQIGSATYTKYIILVTTTLDHDDGMAGVVDCTLREALSLSANIGSAEPASIVFAPGVFGVIGLNNALGVLPAVVHPTRIIGPGARSLALTGQLGVRPLLKFTDTAENRAGTSLLSGLTLRNARGVGFAGDGAGLLVQTTPGTGAGIIVRDCAFTENEATTLAGSQPGQAGGTARGGGVFNAGIMTVERCSFNGNTAAGGSSRGSSTQFVIGPAGGGGLGGAIYNDTGATLTVVHSSFANNSATGGNGASNTDANSVDGAGGKATGAIHNQGTLVVRQCTLSANTAAAGLVGGGTAPNTACGGVANSGACQIGGTICAGNSFTVGNTVPPRPISADPPLSGPDVVGGFTSNDWNLIGQTTGAAGFTAAHDQAGTAGSPIDAKLGVFQNHGGAGDTFLLLTGSPALDRGSAFGFTTDQRGLHRTYDNPALANAATGDATDIGAVEMQPAYTGPVTFTAIEFAGPVLHLTLQGAVFTDYQLQDSPGLLTGSFANLGQAQVTDSVGQTTFTAYGPVTDQHYYRAFKAP